MDKVSLIPRLLHLKINQSIKLKIEARHLRKTKGDKWRMHVVYNARWKMHSTGFSDRAWDSRQVLNYSRRDKLKLHSKVVMSSSSRELQLVWLIQRCINRGNQKTLFQAITNPAQTINLKTAMITHLAHPLDNHLIKKHVTKTLRKCLMRNLCRLLYSI